MAHSSSLPSNASKLPPIILSWMLMTAVGAAIFGAIVAFLGDGAGSDAFPRMVLGVLMGGLILGWLEWQTLQLYRVSVGPLWCGVNTGMLVLLTAIAASIGGGGGDTTFFLLPLWGVLLDLPRWWLLRSHFSRAWWWVVFCGIGWVVDGFLFLAAGMFTLDFVEPVVLFVALNGAINGAWMGLCRGGCLTILLRDRQNKAAIVPTPLSAE